MAMLKEQLQLVCSPRTAITELASNPRAAPEFSSPLFAR